MKPMLMDHPQRSPPGMIPAHLAYRRLDLRADLMRARLRPPGPGSQGAQAACSIAADPRMHALPRHPGPFRHLGNRYPGRSFQHRPVTLLDNGQFDQRQSRPPAP
jgi:hypothetical protein